MNQGESYFLKSINKPYIIHREKDSNNVLLFSNGEYDMTIRVSNIIFRRFRE